MMLLDTSVLFWMEHDPFRISETARKAIAPAEARCFASSISALELGLKAARGLIKLPLEPENWLDEVCTRRQIEEVPVDFGIAGTSAKLPPIHKDPFDRIIIATALRLGLTIITPDEAIRRYGAVKTLW